MSKLVTVKIAHRLGKEEATRRLKEGMDQAQAKFGPKISSFEKSWQGNHLDFRVGAMGQVVGGFLEVEEDHVMAEFELPSMLAFFANKVKGLLQKQGALMLEDKS